MDINLQTEIDKNPIRFLIIGFFVLFVWTVLTPTVSEATVESRRQELREKMESVKKQIDKYSQEIKDARKREMTIEEQVGMYDKKIKKLELQIQSVDMSIQETGNEIKGLEERLSELENSVDKEKQILRKYIQTTWQNEDFSTVEVVFGNDDLSHFVNKLKEISQFRQSMLAALKDIRTEKETLAKEKEELRNKRTELYDMKGLQEIQKRTLAQQKKNQKELLAEARQTKNVFMSLVEDSRSELEKIQEKLYELKSVGVSMKLVQAIDKAKFVSKKTGVRPALLLAVLKKESKMGDVLGSGYWREDMHPSQHGAFLEICKKNGLDPDKMPVSSPWTYGGWGGAMGPAQFMPTTWMGYEKQVEKLTGDSPVSPYNFEHALMALALKLKKAGADSGTYEDEFNAIMQFFSGNSWNWHEERAYGDPIMNDYAPQYQRQIEVLEEGGY